MTLKAARDLAGLSQVALAKATTISQQRISDIERGDTEPSFDEIESIVTALRANGLLGVTAGHLFGEQAKA